MAPRPFRVAPSSGCPSVAATRGRPTHLVTGAAVVALVGVSVVGCGSSTDTASSSSSTTAAPATSAPATTAAPTTEPIPLVPGQVTIRDYELLPPTVTVAAGGTVTWVNADDVDHWMLTDDGTTVDSGAFAGGTSYVATLPTAGTYDYYCEIHNTMVGTIVVE